MKELKIILRYRYRLCIIQLEKHFKLKRLWIASMLLRAANKLDPSLMREYDRGVIRNYERTGGIGLKW